MRKLGVWLGALLLVLVASVEASAQRRVTGSVTSTTGEPIGNVVVNVQGDLPTIDPGAIASSILPLSDPAVDLATLV